MDDQETYLKRIAYVCTEHEIKYVNDVGYCTLTSAFIHRPTNCQYLIAELNGKEVATVDMFQLLICPHNILHLGERVHTFPTAEAAIMCAISTN